MFCGQFLTVVNKALRSEGSFRLSTVTVMMCIMSLFNTLTHLAGLVIIKATPLLLE